MVCFFSVNCVRLVTVLCKQARQRLSRLRQWSAGIIRKYCCHFKRRETWTTVSGRPYQQNNYTVVAPPSKTHFSWGGHLLVSNLQMFSIGPFRWALSLQWLWTLAMKIDEGCFVDLSDGAVTMGKLLGACLLGLLNPRPGPTSSYLLQPLTGDWKVGTCQSWIRQGGEGGKTGEDWASQKVVCPLLSNSRLPETLSNAIPTRRVHLRR